MSYNLFLAFKQFQQQFRAFDVSEEFPNLIHLNVFGLPIFWEKVPKFLTQFDKFGSWSNMCQNLVAIDQATTEISQRKKEINDITVSDWPA